MPIKHLHYTPYGSALPGLQYNYADNGDTSKYRFGFNTQERDDEIAGVGNIYTAEFWEYDARLGRRWNRDPIQKEYESDFSCFNNNPVIIIDPFGNDEIKGVIHKSASDKMVLIPENATIEIHEKTEGDKPIASKTLNTNVDISIASGSVRAYTTITGARYVASWDSKGVFLGYQNYIYMELNKDISNVSMSVAGKVIETEQYGVYNSNKGIEGILHITANYSDGTFAEIGSYNFTSGPHGNGPLPNGEYSIYEFQWTNKADKGMAMDKNADKSRNYKGWKLKLPDRKDLGRDGLRLHPDTNKWGTKGCVGIRGYNYEALLKLGKNFESILNINKSINFSFQVPENPNYHDQGKSSSSSGQ